MSPQPDGVRIARRCIPEAPIDDALRLLHIDLLTHGADAERLGTWLWGAHWFPHLKDHPAIHALADALPEDWRTGQRCDPQILLQFPHVGPEPPITFHRDEVPAWAGERAYARIVGVPLSPWRQRNGGLVVGGRDAPSPIEVDPGDAVMMAPDVLHTGGINRTGTIRYGVYFRWLQAPLAGTPDAPHPTSEERT